MAESPISMMKLERAVRELDHQTIMGCISDISGQDYISQRTSESSILFMNKCKNNVLVNWLQFMFWTQKEPVHKSHLLLKPTTLGALRACATILQSLVKDLFLLPLFSVTLSSPWLKSSTWNTAYMYILFCDNYG